MSQALEDVNVTEAYIAPGRGGRQYPQSAPNQEQSGVSNFVDGSGPNFSMYLEMATELDKKMVEGWKADADGILIFWTGRENVCLAEPRCGLYVIETSPVPGPQLPPSRAYGAGVHGVTHSYVTLRD
ncbi:hypothetical protein H4582DRAFT_2051281 [Lactarius indigo]|nr:hypothetical protein H4582DRAFT_2051281 [Lactarius indigo]